MTELFELKADELHRYWPFLLRGIAYVKRTCKPSWIAEDIYAALRLGQVQCVLARRTDPDGAGRLLGFVVYNKQLKLFNFQPECFIWIAWNLPMREWQLEDQMKKTVRQVWDYVANIARTQYQSDTITWITTPSKARAFQRKFGWHPAWVTVEAKV